MEGGRYLFSSNEICRFLLEISNRGKDHLNPQTDDDWIGWEYAVLKVRVYVLFVLVHTYVDTVKPVYRDHCKLLHGPPQ